MTLSISLSVNGESLSMPLEDPRTTLLDLLREHIGLTGTKKGCDRGQCGACTVLLDGKRINACLTLAASVDGTDVTTIEGLADGDTLHPMQEAFRENHGLQCGFCTPGMVMSALDLVKNNPDPSEKELREWLEGNICRCTGYHNIVKSIKAGADSMR